MAKQTVTYENLATAFKHRNFKPLYFLYGAELFLADELQALLLEHALAPAERDFNLDVMYGAEMEAQAVVAACRRFPMMAERRVVIVRDFEKLKRNAAFKAYAAQPNPQCVVFLVCNGKPNLSAHPYRALKQHAVALDCKALYARQIPGWIQQRAQAMGCAMEPEAIQMLADVAGTNLRTIAEEIDKLITYIGNRTTIVPDDVLAVGGHARSFNVFELQRAIGQKQYATALPIADHMLKQAANRRSEALMVVALLTGYFSKLRKLQALQHRRLPDQALAQQIGVSPYFVKEYVASLRRYSVADLQRAFALLLAADYELKGGAQRDAGLILTLLLRRLLQPEPSRIKRTEHAA